GGRSRVEARDLLKDLEPDGRALGNLRLDAQSETHVLALYRLKRIYRRRSCGGDRRGRRETSGDEGYVLSDDDFRLKVIEREEVRRRENVAEAVRLERARERPETPHGSAVGQRDGVAKHRDRQPRRIGRRGRRLRDGFGDAGTGPGKIGCGADPARADSAHGRPLKAEFVGTI